MYLKFVIGALMTLLVTRVNCKPSEKAEMPQKSPVEVIVEVKDGFGFNFIQKKLINALHPKPIVDTITEEEKYGNMAQHPIGQKVVKAYEGFSNLLNTGFRVPEEAVKQGSRKLTDFLDNIGGKIIGLQK